MELIKGSKEKFDYDMTRGKVGEEIFYNYFKNAGYEVDDLREDEDCHRDDIDFRVHFAESITAEVKTDYKTQYTGNVVFEEISNGRAGCFKRTKADYIFYVIIGKDKEMLQLNVKAFRDLVYNSNYRYCKMGDNEWGFVLPKKDLYKYNVVVRTYHYG